MTQHELPIERGPAGTWIAYVIFALTGLAVVLPGTLLSTLLARWSLSDQQAGLLFFLFFIGSSCGALLSRGQLNSSIARGCMAVALGATALGIASRTGAFVAMTLFGFGLGVSMTSVSLLQSRRRAATRTAEMARLNLTWALGASIGPGLILRGAAAWSVQAVLYTVAAVFAGAALLAPWLLPNANSGKPSSRSWLRDIRAVPALLLVLVPLATGIESSAGGWLAAYSKRSGLLLTGTISTVTCFWAGLLLSRLVQSHRGIAVASKRLVLLVAPWLMAAALLLIILNHDGPGILAGALLLGLGVGPIYPLVLSLLLSHGEAGNAVFLGGGIGASVFPLFTGLVSGWTGSLAAGLTVPLACCFAMGIVGALVSRRSPDESIADSHDR